MIYFVTNKADFYREHLKFSIQEFKDIKVLEEVQGKSLYLQLLSKCKKQSFDLETTGLDAYVAKIMLTGIGNRNNQFVFDPTNDLTWLYEHLDKYKHNLIGANLKFDIKLIQAKYNILLTRVYDVILAEQRLFMKFYQRNNLGELVMRYMNEYRNKDTRLEFVDKNPDTFVFHYHHIKYLANDLLDPMIIREKQIPIMKSYKMEFLIYGVEFPLISILADSENEGIDFDTDKWIKLLNDNMTRLFDIQLKMDEEVRELRDFVATNELYKGLSPAITLSGNKYNKLRTKTQIEDLIEADGTVNVLDLFGDPATVKAITGKKVLKKDGKLSPDYNSPSELVRIFGRLNQPLPIEGGYATPTFKPNGMTLLPVNTYKTNSTVMEKYLIDKPDSIMIPFLKLFAEYSEVKTKISNYGMNYITKINPITGKLHTIYRQCDAATGRFQSGGGKAEPDKFQSQNIPAHIDYRSCFTCQDDEELGTSDYSGAELIVMASHAQDFKLISLSKSDMHSYMATLCWKAVYKFRAGKIYKTFSKMTGGIRDTLEKEWQKYVDLGKNFLVTKTDPPGFRKNFKGMTFGAIYNMYSKKAGEVMNIPKEEGAVMLKVIENELPLTFAMVKEATAMAVKYGCVILNNRTNSRAWFPVLLEQRKGNITKETHFMEISAEESAARNIRIQGTQADFVKEASVVLGTYYRKRKLKAKILLWIHDEIVDKIKADLRLENNPNLDATQFPKNTKQVRGQKLKNITVKKEYYKDIADVKNSIMVEVANRYLHNVTITADHSYNKTWIK